MTLRYSKVKCQKWIAQKCQTLSFTNFLVPVLKLKQPFPQAKIAPGAVVAPGYARDSPIHGPLKTTKRKCPHLFVYQLGVVAVNKRLFPVYNIYDIWYIDRYINILQEYIIYTFVHLERAISGCLRMELLLMLPEVALKYLQSCWIGPPLPTSKERFSLVMEACRKSHWNCANIYRMVIV